MEANSKNPDQTAQTSLKGSFCVHIVYNSRLECRRHKTGIGLNPLIQREREREREREGEGEREREREGERERCLSPPACPDCIRCDWKVKRILWVLHILNIS